MAKDINKEILEEKKEEEIDEIELHEVLDSDGNDVTKAMLEDEDESIDDDEAEEETEEQEKEEEETKDKRASDKRGKRVYIDYGGATEEETMEIALKTLKSGIANNTSFDGKVVAAKRVQFGEGERAFSSILFQVIPEHEDLVGQVPIWIAAEEMSTIINEKSDNRAKGTFGKAILDANIKFCIKDIQYKNPDARLLSDKGMSAIGSRVQHNEKIKSFWFEDSNNPDRIIKNDIVNGKILAVYASKIIYTVAGIDMTLYITVPYLTGLSPVQNRHGGKRLFDINEEKDCQIRDITYDGNGKVTNINLDFQAPLADKIHEIVKEFKRGDYLSAVVLRYVTSKYVDKTTGHNREYVIAKTDVGIEVACPLPNWRTVPELRTPVKVSLTYVTKDNRVFGHLKR